MSDPDGRQLDELRAALAERDRRIAELERELDRVKLESSQRWEAIERLAPTAKRLRIERDKLRAKLAAPSAPEDDDSSGSLT